MINHYDVVIIGLGAMGSAALHALANKSISVLGIDQFNPPHSLGSSHGETRVTRLANGEGDEYTELAIRARKLWRDLEKESGEQILDENGILIFGVPGQESSTFESRHFISETLKQATKNQIPHSYLSAKEIGARFPQFNLTGNEVGYYEPTGGYLMPEKGIRVQLDLALKKGAQKLSETVVNALEFASEPIKVHTSKGMFTCQKLIVSSGSWLPKLFPEFQDKCTIYRQIAIWFKLKNASSNYHRGKFPTFKWKFAQDRVTGIYGFPILDASQPAIKVGIEDYSQKIDIKDHHPHVSSRTVSELYEKYVQARLPEASPEYIKATACIYTVTKDWKFFLDFHPQNRNLIIASPCSGHGFKHSPAIGELLANMCLNEPSFLNLNHFSFSRIETESAPKVYR